MIARPGDHESAVRAPGRDGNSGTAGIPVPGTRPTGSARFRRRVTQEGQPELQPPLRDLLVKEVPATREDVKRDRREASHCLVHVGHGNPAVPVPGHHQARDVNLAQAAGHGIRIPAGHEAEYGTDVGRVAHETAIDVPGLGRHP